MACSVPCSAVQIISPPQHMGMPPMPAHRAPLSAVPPCPARSCNGGVNFMLAWDREGRFRFAALQSDTGRALLRRAGRSPDDISSIVLVERQAAYTKSAAILRIAAGLQAPLPLVAAALDVFPRPFKDWFYDQVGTTCRRGLRAALAGRRRPQSVLWGTAHVNAVPSAGRGASVPRCILLAPIVLCLQVADNRYSIFGRTSACRLSDPRFEDRFVS